MKKHLLTPDGVACLQSELCLLDGEQLQQAAMLLNDDALGWFAGHFELTVNQLELLRSMSPEFMKSIGVNLSAALLARRPFILEGLEIFDDRPHSIMKIKLANATNTEYSLSDHQFKAAGQVVLTFSL